MRDRYAGLVARLIMGRVSPMLVELIFSLRFWKQISATGCFYEWNGQTGSDVKNEQPVRYQS